MFTRPFNIRKMGLPTFLDETKEDHNGFGYAEWKTMKAAKVNIANLARAFNVSRQSIDRWIEIDEEQKDT